MLQLVPARADAEIEPPVRDDVHRGADIGQHGRVAIGVARHHQPDAQPLGQRGEGGQQRPALQARAGRVGAQRHKMVEEPGVLDVWNRVGLAPDPQHVVVGGVLRRRLDAEAQRSLCVRFHSSCSFSRRADGFGWFDGAAQSPN